MLLTCKCSFLLLINKCIFVALEHSWLNVQYIAMGFIAFLFAIVVSNLVYISFIHVFTLLFEINVRQIIESRHSNQIICKLLSLKIGFHL